MFFELDSVPCISGFFTAKGDLVSSILYPQPINFRFYRDAIKFLLFLGVLGKHCKIASLFAYGFPNNVIAQRRVFPWKMFFTCLVYLDIKDSVHVNELNILNSFVSALGGTIYSIVMLSLSNVST